MRLLCSLSVFQWSFRSNGARFWNPFFRIIFIRYLSSFFGHFQLPFALCSPVWALSESHALGEAASLEFNTFFWCCRLGSHDRPVPWPLTQLSFQPRWYNWGQMCQNKKTGCNGRIVTAFINAAQKYYVKMHLHISQQIKPNQSIFKNHVLPTCHC